MKQVFAIIARPPAMHVLQVARAMHEDYAWAAAPEIRRLVEPRVERRAVARFEGDDRRINPVVRPELWRRRISNLHRRSPGAVFLEIKLWRLVAVGVNH